MSKNYIVYMFKKSRKGNYTTVGAREILQSQRAPRREAALLQIPSSSWTVGVASNLQKTHQRRSLADCQKEKEKVGRNGKGREIEINQHDGNGQWWRWWGEEICRTETPSPGLLFVLS